MNEDGMYQLLPPLRPDERTALGESIKERGVIVPVIVDEDGQIIDGHHRAMMADSLGIEYPRQVMPGLSDHEKRVLAVSLNVDRRQLSDAQKVLLGKKIEPDVAAIARQGRRTDLAPTSSAIADDVESDGWKSRTVERVAQRVGLGSGTAYHRHKKVLARVEEEAPELMPYIENGDLSIADVKRELRARHPKPEPTPKAPAAPAKLMPMANVPPEVRRVAKVVHDATQRVRLIRSQYEIGRIALGVEGGVFAGELEALRDELDGFAREIRAAHNTNPTNGGRRDRATG